MLGMPDFDAIPVQLQAILNAVAFLIAATAMWYAYFIKGKSKAADEGDDYPRVQRHPFTFEDVQNICENLGRIATSAEKMEAIMKHEADEAEIARRVRMELIHKRATANE